MVYWSLDPIGGDNYLAVLAVGLGLLGLLALGPPRAKTGGRRRLVLAAIRVGVVLMVLLAMLRPTLVYTETRKQPATLLVLLDKSRSMSVPDGIGGRTRYEALARTLADAQAALEALGEDYEIKVYAFDGQLYPLEVDGGRIALPDTPDGTQTAIGWCLQEALGREAGKRLLGVILLSDGAQQARAPHNEPPQTAAARLKSLGYALYTFPFGQKRGLGQAKDVRLTDLQVNPAVFAKTELAVRGDFQTDGCVNREIPVKLYFETAPGEMKEVAWDKLDVTADNQRIAVDMTYVPETAGEFKLTLEAVPQPGELVTTNNRLSTFVRVLKGGLNVLYLEGEMRAESKFLRRALAASRDMKVDYFLIRRNPAKPLSDGPTTAFIRPAKLDLAEAFRPGKYDVVILGDLDSAAFKPEELGQLADAVSRGTGLIMLGGFHSFGPGGYGQTALGSEPPGRETPEGRKPGGRESQASVLPVHMDRFERQGFGEKIPGDLHLPGPLHMRPSGMGLVNFALKLAPGREANLAAWAKLPPLEGANKLGDPLPGALTLAVDDSGHALMVSHHYGNGRVVALAVDSTWLWQMGGFEADHKRFWRQVVLWLARKDESSEGKVWIQLQGRRFAPGQRVEFSVGANDETGEPVTDATFQAKVVLPDGKEVPVQLVSGDGQLVGTFQDGEIPGDYRVEVTATHRDHELGTARARFLVYEQDLELDHAQADVGTMDSLAAITGEESSAPEQLRDLLERLGQETADLEVDQINKLTFWDKWPFFLVLVGLLGLEWYLRKRWGLV